MDSLLQALAEEKQEAAFFLRPSAFSLQPHATKLQAVNFLLQRYGNT